MNVLGLFSGIGGMELGLQRAGFNIVGMCEIDPYCQAVLRKHWPTVMVYEDARTIVPFAADWIVAGFPCQDISLAGPGAGLSGNRSGLFGSVMRAVGLVRPVGLVLENVAELLGRGMGEVCGSLAAVGYDAEWDCIPTCFDLCHRRDRVFIVADDMRERLSRGSDPRTHPQDARNVFSWPRFAEFFTSTIPAEKWGDRYLLGRGIYGIPNRMDRIKAIGNSVRPQIPEIIGRAIMQAEGLT